MYICDSLFNNRMLEKNAVICGKKQITYRKLYEKAYNLGKLLKRKKGDIVIIYMPDCIEYVISFFAALFGDKIVYPISFKSKGDEILSSIEKTGCTCILTLEENSETVRKCINGRNVEILVVDSSQLKDAVGDKYWNLEKDKKDTCLLLNTSGSTSMHKIVMLSNYGVCTNCEDWIDIALNSEQEGRILVSLPVCTSFGSIIISTCIMLGWTIIFMPSFFNISGLLETIEQEKVTHLISIGSALNMMALNIKRMHKSKYNVDSLAFIGVGGNKAVPQALDVLGAYFKNAGMSPGYGITEATCMVSTIAPDIFKNNRELYDRKADSAGIPFKHCKISIYTGEEYTSEANIEGEVVISGPTLMNGYFRNESETKKVLKSGYLHTGDIGFIDEDGFLYIIGRKKNLIKSSGYSVFPEEVEAVITESGLVREILIYGVKDDLLDEVVVADVVLEYEEVTEYDLMQYCIQHLAEYKIPKRINIVKKIEKTSNGKIKRGNHEYSR